MNRNRNEEHVKILPPTVKIAQSGKRPYAQRVDQVFQALDEASSSGLTTYTALIDFVQKSTGTSCSRKLVARWKKERAVVSPAREQLATPREQLAASELKALGVPIQVEKELPKTGQPLTESTRHPQMALMHGKEGEASSHRQKDRSKQVSVGCQLRESILIKTLTEQFSNPVLSGVSLTAGKLKVLGGVVVAAAIGLGLILAGERILNADQVVEPWEPWEVITSQSNPSLPSPSVPMAPAQGESSGSPKTLKLDLTISSPKDLKVREGDTVVAGEVLADRVEERSRLSAQLQTLEIEYKQLASRTIPAPPPPVQVPEVKGLPPISYEEEEAAIAAAGVNVRQAERAFQLQQQSLKTPPIEESAAVQRASVEVANRQRIVDNQKRKIDAVAMLKDLPEEVMPHEQEVLKQKEAELQQAQADYEQAQAKLSAASQAQTEKLQQLGVALEKAKADQRVAIAKLQTKKDQRAYTEYEASVAAAKRAEERNFASISHMRQLQETEQRQRDRDYQLAQIQTKIAEVKQQLSLVSVVTSPYSGVIKSVKVQRQTNNSLAVEITIAVGGRTGVPSPSPDTTPAPTPDEFPTPPAPDEPTPTPAPDEPTPTPGESNTHPSSILTKL